MEALFSVVYSTRYWHQNTGVRRLKGYILEDAYERDVLIWKWCLRWSLAWRGYFVILYGYRINGTLI